MAHSLNQFLVSVLVKRYFLPANFLLSARQYPDLLPRSYSSEQFARNRTEAVALMEEWLKEERGQDGEQLATMVHPHWQVTRNRIRDLIRLPLREDFLRDPVLQQNIGWGGGPLQPWHAGALAVDRVSKKLRSFMGAGFTESRVGSPYLAKVMIDGASVPITPGTLHHAHYLGRIDRANLAADVRILEFGGGYGGLARLARLYLPEASYAIIDAPESLAIQHLYYRTNFPQLEINIPKPGEAMKGGVLNLVPFWRVASLKIKPDVFVSTFALSETTPAMREAVSARSFFDAPLVYLQAGRDDDFSSHDHLPAVLEQHFPKVKPVDSIMPNCYEIMADASSAN